MAPQDPIFEYLELISELIPANFYWMDLDSRFTNLNQRTLVGIGGRTKADVIGKTVYELYKNKAIADELQQDIDKVIRTGILSRVEDKIVDVTTGRFRYFSATRAPLRNINGEIIGIVGTSIETTAEKETERLKLENETNKEVIAEQERFKKIVGQLLHDLQSPLSSIGTIVKESVGNMPEDSRVTLKNAAEDIRDLSNNLLNQYQNKNASENIEEPLLVSLALIQVMSEKRYEYKKNTNITFKLDIEESGNFTFIKINYYSFKHMISNLVNNAVQAVKYKTDGRVTIELSATSENVVIFVTDNGCGMPKHIQENFKKGISITEGKEKGHGIGLVQVYDTIKAGGGTFSIFVQDKISTEIVIRFNKIDTPHWLASAVKLTKDDIVIILDDDDSIHGAWDIKFKNILVQFPTIKTKHFTKGKEAINFINKLDNKQKQDIFLLTDFELLNQGLNGLDVVEQTNIKRALLVTSYFNKKEIQDLVVQARIKMLPKELTSAVSIKVDKKIIKWSKKVDMVWVEDQKDFVLETIKQYYSHLAVDTYYEPDSFMEEINQYPLDTRIILDTYYKTPEGKHYMADGFQLAYELHSMGYTKLILFTGEVTMPKNVPTYLTVILKMDLEGKKNLHQI